MMMLSSSCKPNALISPENVCFACVRKTGETFIAIGEFAMHFRGFGRCINESSRTRDCVRGARREPTHGRLELRRFRRYLQGKGNVDNISPKRRSEQQLHQKQNLQRWARLHHQTAGHLDESNHAVDLPVAVVFALELCHTSTVLA